MPMMVLDTSGALAASGSALALAPCAGSARADQTLEKHPAPSQKLCTLLRSSIGEYDAEGTASRADASCPD